MTKEEKELLALARVMIRDMVHNWPIKELQEPPLDVVNKITNVLGDTYDFHTGEADEHAARR